MKRRIAAIMVGDIVGYSAMMEQSEEKTGSHDPATTCQALGISEKVGSLDGRIFNRAGDATLAEFPSPINALHCAVEIGVALAGSDGSDVEPLKMRFGLHLADVAVHGDDLVGDGVNLAARIQQAAAPGSVWVSGVLFDHIRRNSPFIFDDLGERPLQELVPSQYASIKLFAEKSARTGFNPRRPDLRVIRGSVRRLWRSCRFQKVSGGDEDQRFLAEGLTEELIVELGPLQAPLCHLA